MERWGLDVRNVRLTRLSVWYPIAFGRTFHNLAVVVSRVGDRNRDARLVRLRPAVPVTNAIVGIALPGEQTGHLWRILGRRPGPSAPNPITGCRATKLHYR